LVLQSYQNWQGTFSRARIHICDIAEKTPQKHIEEHVSPHSTKIL
jgi:hypothetical protein